MQYRGSNVLPLVTTLGTSHFHSKLTTFVNTNVQFTASVTKKKKGGGGYYNDTVMIFHVYCAYLSPKLNPS